ncbi:MAG: M48 family metalloprotease [Bryobacteraceae bacterium]|nr:M48 family metalloprotease [Bryobacteraceae bacterium]
MLGISHDTEAEADQLAAQYLWKGGFDPKGFLSFFDRMSALAGRREVASFFHTHPPSYKRVAASLSELDFLPPRQAAPSGTAALTGETAAARTGRQQTRAFLPRGLCGPVILGWLRRACPGEVPPAPDYGL